MACFGIAYHKITVAAKARFGIPYMPTRDAVGRTRTPFYGPESFTYLPDSNSYICPAGQQLNYGGRNEGNRTFGYIGTRKKCGPCQQRSQCTTGPFHYLAIHMNEAARQRARDLRTTPEFKHTQRKRKKVEALFAELKSHSHIGLHRLRLRRLKFVREQFFLAATAQNIKRLVRFLSGRTIPPISLSCTPKRPKHWKRRDLFNTHAYSHHSTFRAVGLVKPSHGYAFQLT